MMNVLYEKLSVKNVSGLIIVGVLILIMGANQHTLGYLDPETVHAP